MQISTILDHIDSGHMALPEFQRGYVWNREQVRGLFSSLYKRHPVGGLLVWATESRTASHRGGSPLASGIVKLLLDGQQRMTSLYGVLRGKPPKFFDGNPKSFADLRFNLDSESFEFYQPVKMRDDPLWIDVTQLFKDGVIGLGKYIATLAANPDYADKVGTYAGHLTSLLGITAIDLHIEEVTGEDKSLDVVVDIFNRVNSGGTKLSKGDLALAKVCAEWPTARDEMKKKLKEWSDAGYQFNLDWLLRSINTVLTGEAKFSYLHDKSALDIENGLSRASKHIDTCLNHISGRLGLDHDRVFFGRFGIPVMVRYLDKRQAPLNAQERDKLLFWYVQAGMWGRFSGSTESFIDKDLETLVDDTLGLDGLLDQLKLWHGGLRVQPGHFSVWGLGSRFYPVLYMLTRMGEAQDWGTGIALKASLLGRMSRLEVHHIFPKSRLYERNHKRPDANALANFCFLTKDTNLDISNRLPEDYFPEVEDRHPGALTSQWIPTDKSLWKIDRYLDFLEARKKLLAAETNKRLQELLHGDKQWLDEDASVVIDNINQIGGITSEIEEDQLETLNDWISEQGLPIGNISFAYSDPNTGEQRAIFDLAWPDGLQPGLSTPVALLLNEGAEVISIASSAGYRCFNGIADFRNYVSNEILRENIT